MIEDIYFEFGAVQIMSFAPPKALKYTTTVVVEESMYSYAPKDFARSAFDDPQETAYTFRLNFAAY